MRFEKLQDWLDWQEGLNPKSIDLGLDRVQQVWQSLPHSDLSSSTIISIAGTNGKGSSVAFFESIYKQAGYSTGSYTSPHLLRYNERIRLDANPVSDAQIMDAFQLIDHSRGDIPLTYFEFGTLAALVVFSQTKPDVVLLEVGLGGRLDAVNIIDADLALITSIDLDHQAWLGNSREVIGREKAGIFRAGQPAVFSALDIPQSIRNYAQKLGTRLLVNGEDFTLEHGADNAYWQWFGINQSFSRLPLPALRGRHQLQNAAGVIMATQLLLHAVPVTESALQKGLQNVRLGGRQQRIEYKGVEWVLDVAHNPHAVAALRQQLQQPPVSGRTVAVLGMLQDKDVAGVLDLLDSMVQQWHFASIDDVRGMSGAELKAVADVQLASNHLQAHDSVAEALDRVQQIVVPGDRVVVFGSFFTVAEAFQLPFLQRG